MEISQEFERHLIKELRRVAKHGFGELKIKVEEVKGARARTKIVIYSGISQAFFIEKDLQINMENML